MSKLIVCHSRRFRALHTLGVGLFAAIVGMGGCGGPVPDDGTQNPPANLPTNGGNGGGDSSGDGTGSAGGGDTGGADTGGGSSGGGGSGGGGTSTGPTLAIVASQSSLDFGADQSALPLTLHVSGANALAYSMIVGADWVSSDAPVGTLLPDDSDVTIRVDRTRLSLGEQSTVLSVIATGAAPLSVQIHALGASTSSGDPQLYVSVQSLEFGSGATSMPFAVQNFGGGTLSYQVSADAAWIAVSPASGDSAGEGDSITASVDRTGLSAGEYDGTITVTAGLDQKQIAVHLYVAADVPPGQPQLYVSRNLLDFGSTLESDALVIQNQGQGQLVYTVTTDVAWATPSASAGESVGEEDVLHVSVSRAGLDPGSYSGALIIASSDGQVFAVGLRLSVASNDGDPAPILAVSTSSLDFGDETDVLSFEIRNNGGGTLFYAIASDSVWAGPSISSGMCTTETDDILVAVDRGSLVDGLHHATLTVSSTNGGSQQIEISLNKIDIHDMEHFPFYQYLVSYEEMPLLTDANRHVLLRQVVSNFWFNPNTLESERTWYRANVPGAQLGRYFVPFNATPEPMVGSLPNKMSAIPDEWLMRDTNNNYFIIYYGTEARKNLDLTRPEVRQAQINFWIQNSAGWDTLLIDHFFYKYTAMFDYCAPGPDAWWAAMKSLAQEYSAASDKPIYINCIGRPEQTWNELIPVVDGFFYESALGDSVYFSQANWRKYYFDSELLAYRAALDAGKVVMITNNKTWTGISGDYALSQPAVMGPLLSAAVCLVRNPGDPLYYNTNITRSGDFSSYGFHDWWRLLGTPLGAFYWNDMVCKREFSKGRVEFDLTTSMPAVRIILTNGTTYTN